ncbi:MFS transporter [Tamaricihabitans halophyticus]|uniref:MFS transporter n=1 Tax=Tamaricihabitans halophyticus TaxID=1262583 RepID=UPI0014050922|nr:MFS transporter [Tamaricihabitans halophyticus]
MQRGTADHGTGRLAGLLSRQGIEPKLAWGFLGLTLFMVGDGLDNAYLANLLISYGYSQPEVGTVLTAYGVTVAIAAWLAGALSAGWGPRRIMVFGIVGWITFQVLFIVFGIIFSNFVLGLITYTIRGLAYPLFAFGFLTWVTLATPEGRLGRAVGWYWFFSSAGMGVLGAYWAGFGIPIFGMLNTLWTSLFFAVAGGLTILLIKDVPRAAGSTGQKIRQACTAITIVVHRPRVAAGGAVRLVNSVAVYAFAVFLPVYMVEQVGFTVGGWQYVWGTMQLANIIGNVINGYLGDWFGRVWVVRWVGCGGTAVTVLLILYAALWAGPSYPVMLIAVCCYGFTLAAFVPLSAIVPLLAKENKAAAIAILNLGAGAAQAVGPLIPLLFLGGLGVVGVFWIIAAVYACGFLLTFLLRPRGEKAASVEAGEHAEPVEARAGIENPTTRS